MSLTALAFWIAYLGGTVGALFNPIAGIALYILVYHLNPETQWWGDSVRALELRTSFVVAAATGLGMLVRQPPLEHGARQLQAPFVLAAIFGLLALGSLVWGLEVTDRSEYLAEKFIKTLIILFILVRCVRTPLHYHVVIVSWLVGLAYLGYEATGGIGILQGGRLTAGLGGPDFNDSSGLAVHLVSSLPLIGAMFFMARTWRGRVLVLLTGAMVVNTIVATRTRNVLVGLAVMVGSGLLSLPRGYRLKGFLATAVGALLSVQLTDPGWWRRMETIFHYEQDASSTARLALWKAAAGMAVDHPFGIGLGNFHYAVMDYVPALTDPRSAHNTIAACLAELGWPGLFVFLTIVGLSLHRLKVLQRIARESPGFTEIQLYRWRTRFHLGWHAVALRTALLGYLACSLFTTRLFTEDLWLLLGFGMCLVNVSQYMTAETPDQALAPSEPLDAVQVCEA
jgi:O-antigen ligase